MVPAGVVGVSVLETGSLNKGKIIPRVFGYNLARNGLLCSAVRNLFAARCCYSGAKHIYSRSTHSIKVNIKDWLLKGSIRMHEEDFRRVLELANSNGEEFEKALSTESKKDMARFRDKMRDDHVESLKETKKLCIYK